MVTIDDNSVSLIRMTRTRFAALWSKHNLKPSPADPNLVYDELMHRYSEGHRFYHTPAHIDFCLLQLDLAKHLMEDADAVEMALWFHDLIYDPAAVDNEVKSAERFIELTRGSLDPMIVEKVRDLILTTISGGSPQNLDEGFIVDIDLSSLALPWPEFQRDALLVRKELRQQQDHPFYVARRKFYRSLLDRPAIYFTKFFRERLERTAVQNIRWYLEGLRVEDDD